MWRGYIVSNVLLGFDWISVPCCASTELPVSSFRIDAAIPIQMDSELALRRGRDVLIKAVLDRAAGSTRHAAPGIPHNQMAEASQCLPSGCPSATSASSHRDQTSQDCQSSDSRLHHD